MLSCNLSVDVVVVVHDVAVFEEGIKMRIKHDLLFDMISEGCSAP